MPAGRPSKYNKNIQTQADNYVNGGFADAGDIVPSIAGLAVELGINRQTVYEWRKRHKKFSDTLDRLDALQERLSLNGGLQNKLNSTIVKLLLANHGYSEKHDQNLRSEDGSMSPPTKIEIVAGKDDDT